LIAERQRYSSRDVPTRLLLIEDNPGDALIFREKLRESDLDCELVHSKRLEEGMELIEDGDFDIILVDLSLPDASGLEAVIRVVDAAPDVPVVVLTGLDDANIAAQARHEGAIDYLVKWYQDGPTLARYIRYAIAQRRVESRRAEDDSSDDTIVPLEAPLPEPAEEAPALPRDPEPRGDVPGDPLRAALDPCREGIVVARSDGRIEYANSRARSWLGGAERYPWPLDSGISRITAGASELVQDASPTRWQGEEAFVVILRTDMGNAGTPGSEPALLEAAEASLEFLKQSENRNRWMAGVLRNAFDLEQQVRNDTAPTPALMDLVERVHMATRELHSMALERGVSINIKASREKIATTADRQLLDTLLRRLFTDALVTASAPSVEVEITLISGEPRVAVSWEVSLPEWTAVPSTARALSRRVLAQLVQRAGGHCQVDEEGGRDVITIILPKGGAEMP
jgi:CheY-like chemotaxis protein